MTVAPKYQNQGWGKLLTKRIFWILKQGGVEVVAGAVMDESTTSYVKSLGFEFNDPNSTVGPCYVSITNAQEVLQPEQFNEEIKEVVWGTDSFLYPDDDVTIPMNMLSWFDKETGEVVARGRYKVLK